MSTTIRSLPTETLTEIFQHAFLTQTVEEWHKHALPHLRLVSRYWDAIILGLPLLWTSLLVTEVSAHQPGRSPFESTHIRITRSRQLPLAITIRLETPTRSKVFDEKDGAVFGDMILKLAPRIASLELRTESRALQAAILFPLRSATMPLLHSFSHIGCENSELGDSPDFSGFIEEDYHCIYQAILQIPGMGNRETLNEEGKRRYPVLEDVKITGALYHWDWFPIMHGMRRLSMHIQPWGTRQSMRELIVMLLPVRETLEVLELVDVMRPFGDSEAFFVEPVVFKKLEVLSLGYQYPEIAEAFLVSVRMPALVDLTLTYTSIGRETYDERDCRHLHLVLALIRLSPLALIRSLSLNGVVFCGLHKWKIEIPLPENVSDAERIFYVESLNLVDFTPIYGHRLMPLLIFFLYKFTSLKHLIFNDCRGDYEGLNLMEEIGDFWQLGCFPTLESFHLDGPQNGLLNMVSMVENDKLFGYRPHPLQITVGERLESALSEDEKAELDHYTKVLANCEVR